MKAADGVMTDAKGMTLYSFDKDAGGKSACNGPCATNWPPLMAGADAKAGGDWSIITRDDGAKQWAYKGKPVYTWVKDAKPGDKTGDGLPTAPGTWSRTSCRTGDVRPAARPLPRPPPVFS